MAKVNVVCHVHKEDGIHSAELALDFPLTFDTFMEMLRHVFDADFDQFLYADEEDYCTVTSQADVDQMTQWWLRQGSDSKALIIHAVPQYQRPGLYVQVNPETGQATELDAPVRHAVDEQSTEIQPSDVTGFQLIGRGAAGSVYRARHVPTNAIMAVKVIDFDVSPAVQQRIVTELDILHKCRSPHIITYFGTYFGDNGIHICTEYMDGGSLDRHGIISEPVLAVITRSVLDGLSYLSKVKVMHRDVKPSNILVNRQGHIKLCDFGVSRELEQSVTRTFVGTNAYMAPERIQHQPYNERSETWSLGLTLQELATGTFPYLIRRSGLTPIELVQVIVSEPAPELPSEFSHDFRDFVRRCLIKEPDLRPAARHLLDHEWITSIHDGHHSAFSAWIHGIDTRLGAAHMSMAQ
ncbi:STE/STE7 protein kinase [Salpingoeca rosetta]|uniref:mitogen-activated protein kinase kinase n=1 Tax=Salpingoeca rosetta (strain ATCC 50818 / BSB-021) TaxID=946362 RepID=F2U8R1_SALR5|nr:STE/STE7 protein kinase [Salpingoeca rosetta]EGD72769.1 STE/STE7 protein kinase [Salpingoeca rosetta]|eukprot:XP_004994592.1 STE/STE7 protein kinase [Salpingoeca rosetta]